MKIKDALGQEINCQPHTLFRITVRAGPYYKRDVRSYFVLKTSNNIDTTTTTIQYQDQYKSETMNAHPNTPHDWKDVLITCNELCKQDARTSIKFVCKEQHRFRR
jgi:hypothetical protein